MRSTIGWVLFALLASVLAGPACTHATYREIRLSNPVVTDDQTVWWAEASMRDHDSETSVIMCKRGANPVCVRIRPESGAARHR